MEKFGKFSLGTILFALAIFVQSVVQMFMWNWFIVPLGLPAISFWLTMGISLTISAFHSSQSKVKSEDLIKGFTTSCFVYLAFWGVGALVHLFI
jgi:hypothetical protein